MNQSNSLVWQVVALVAGLVVLWTFASSKWVDRYLSNFISKLLKRYTRISAQDFARLFHLAGEYQVNEMQVREQDWLTEKTIAELGLRKEGIIVLGITRRDGNYIGAPDGDTQIKKHDVLILYGRANVMQELDQRKAGSAGNRAHH